jgi:TolB-like protein/Tfp pilus assembly protein PilF
VPEPSHAVFLSYASQDAEAAQKIGEALRAGGIEVFLDQSELRGGDAWDHKIRHEIHECALFIPMVSQHTQERLEGYFRHEWNLAIERAHHMARQKPFLIPVVVDGTGDREALVPDEFRAVQWTRLPGGEIPSEFVARIHRLLSPEVSTPDRKPTPSLPAAGLALPARGAASLSRRRMSLVIALLAAVALVYLLIGRPWNTKRETSPAVVAPSALSTIAPTTFSPPPHSIAVLPFVNMSGDKDQEYFSDGLTEEILNSLVRINELQVSARTSSFSFKGTNADLATIAHKLNVASVLEGSVRRAGHTVRVTAQLNNAVTAYHVWSQTYDRDLKDVLKLQTEIATAVADALKVTLLGDVAAKIEAGGTRNPAAFDAYIRALKIHWAAGAAKEEQGAIDGFTQALRLDRDYALAYAGRSLAVSTLVIYYPTTVSNMRANLERALADARQTIALAPGIAEGHLALASAYEGSLEFAHADEEYKRALSLAPSNARVLRDYGNFALFMSRSDSGLTMLRRAAALDPLNYNSPMFLGIGLQLLRRYDEALAALSDALALADDASDARGNLAVTQYLRGDLQGARSSCEKVAEDNDYRQQCLALAYHKLGQHAEAADALTKLEARWGDSGATVYAQVYAQWGDTPKALESLDAALRLRDPRLEGLKTDPLLDPLRHEPRFQAIERELKFPQ